MLSNSVPMAFLSTSNADDARAFYENVLGLKFLVDDGFALVFELSGTVLRLQKIEGYEAQSQTVHGWMVDDIREVVRTLTEKGVVFLKFPMFKQDELGIWSTNGAKIAWFADPDGNTLSLTEVETGG